MVFEQPGVSSTVGRPQTGNGRLDSRLITATQDEPVLHCVDRLRLLPILGLLVALTVGDSVLGVILFDLFDERLSLFVNQGTAFVYIVTSVIALAVMRYVSAPVQLVDSSLPMIDVEGNLIGPLSEALKDKRHAPWYFLVTIGLLNGSANFFQAISQPHTPGLSQTLLPLLGIPLVLSLVWIFLGRRPSLAASLGAVLIVGGGFVSALRSILNPSDSGSGEAGSDSGDAGPIVVYVWAIALFGTAQFFLAFEKVKRVHRMGWVGQCWRWRGAAANAAANAAASADGVYGWVDGLVPPCL